MFNLESYRSRPPPNASCHGNHIPTPQAQNQGLLPLCTEVVGKPSQLSLHILLPWAPLDGPSLTSREAPASDPPRNPNP